MLTKIHRKMLYFYWKIAKIAQALCEAGRFHRFRDRKMR